MSTHSSRAGFCTVAALSCAVLLFAFRRDPLLFLRAVFWRLGGLKVRSRNTFSTLASESPHAYRLWMATREEALPAAPKEYADRISEISILIFIDPQSTYADLVATLQSIALAGSYSRLLIFDPSRKYDWAQTAAANLSETTILSEWNELIAHLKVLENEWVCPIVAGDCLRQSSLDRYSQELTDSDFVIYADDDLISVDGKRSKPYFKPDWNAELFRFQDFISFSCILKVGAHDLRNCINAEGYGQFIKAMVAKILQNAIAEPKHIAQILHHRRKREFDDQRRPRPIFQTTHSDDTEKVTIIIPTKNKRVLLQKCVEGILQADFQKKEIIIIDHDSNELDTINYLNSVKKYGVKIMNWSGNFNYSAMNNEASKLSTGSYICFLNNDIEMIGTDWLSILMGQATRPDIGAVGAKLLYPNGTIQHAGVTIGIGGAAGHAHRYCPESSAGYFNRPHITQYVAAVTAACMVVKRSKFDAVGGFDETLFPVAFNDVDLCLKLGASGWKSLYEPRSVLIHHESISRGSDKLRKNRNRFARELQALKDKWGTDHIRDPYHNPNLSPLSEQFVIDI